LGHRRGILALKGASFSYGPDAFGIGPMDVALHEGEMVGLLGANGSGKSTILKLMGGLLKPDAGGVDLWGQPIASMRNRDRAKLVSYLPQVLDMNVPFTVGQLAGMGLYPYERGAGMGVDEALGLVGLADRSGDALSRLSGGQRRRAYIAMTLVQGAGILLLDEPLANLDVRYQVETIRLLRDLNEKRGMAIMMALHDISLAHRFDALVLLHHGRVIARGTPETVLREDLLREAFETDIDVRRLADGRLAIYY